MNAMLLSDTIMRAHAAAGAETAHVGGQALIQARVGDRSMSAAERRQRAALHLADVLVDAVEASCFDERNALPGELEAAGAMRLGRARILRRLDGYGSDGFGSDSPDGLTRESWRPWARLILALIDVVDREFPDVINPRELVVAVLAVVAEIEEQTPREPIERRAEWVELHHAVAMLYQVYDPDLSAPEIERGAEIGRMLRGVMG